MSDESEPTSTADVDGLSYEEAREQLVDTVRRLETGGASLEESLALWERGEKLAAACQRWLDGATARLDKAMAARESAGIGDTDPDA